MNAETRVRAGLRQHVSSGRRAVIAIDEFWVPISNERADLALIGDALAGFEIKTDRDTLRRLPRQASAYARIFDRCTAVVAERHYRQAVDFLPTWWGMTIIQARDGVSFDDVRQAGRNPVVDPETLVRLLWRAEVITALKEIGEEPDPRRSRLRLWQDLLEKTAVPKLKSLVRAALRDRNAGRKHLSSEGIRNGAPAVSAGR